MIYIVIRGLPIGGKEKCITRYVLFWNFFIGSILVGRAQISFFRVISSTDKTNTNLWFTRLTNSPWHLLIFVHQHSSPMTSRTFASNHCLMWPKFPQVFCSSVVEHLNPGGGHVDQILETGADPRIFDWGWEGEGGSKLWFRKDCWNFLSQITSPPPPPHTHTHTLPPTSRSCTL